jgi:MtrB/PioB family decaheme-associated outer membrane protein
MNNKYMTLMTITLLAFAAETMAENAELDELTKPKSKIEAGVGGVTQDSWKFGQYNGLNKSGAFGIGNFDIRGGGDYDSNDATRWRITGSNIGLENRRFTGDYKNQGQYKLHFGYDEIPANRNNSYTTPYNGAGGNVLTLPPNWVYPNPANNMRALSLGDIASFHSVQMGTKRRQIDGGFSYLFTPEWEAQASFRHENKDGTQTIGAPIVAARGVILPNPISQSTDQINASMKYTGTQGFGQFAYYGSLFHNDINGLNFQNPFASGAPTMGRMSTMPDNQFHQFSLTGGYNFSHDTKLVMNGAYARNWQNQSFLPYSTLAGGGGTLPTGSLNGDVETKSVNLKLTHRVNKDLNLMSAYKYDERDNNTPVNMYNFTDVDATGAATNFRSNTPFSKRINQGNLEADYSFAKGHWLKAGYEIQGIDRWCKGTWTSCVDTGSTLEHTGRIDYRGTWFDKISSRIGYSYANRTADGYNQDTAAAASYPATNALLLAQVSGTGLPAWGPFLPYALGNAALFPTVFPNNNTATSVGGNMLNNSIDINGLGRFNTSNRTRQKANARFDYQATDKLGIGLGGDFRYDDYPNSDFGLQSSRNWGINLDGNYAFDADTNMQLFYSHQNIVNKSSGMSYGSNTNTGVTTAGSVVGGCVPSVLAMNNTAKTDPCRGWTTDMADDVDTVGLGVKHKGFFDGKLDVNGDFLYSFAKTLIGVAGGQYVQSPLGTATNGPFLYIPASNMPAAKTEMFQFKLDSKYIINKPSALHLTYLYQRMMSSDYTYTGAQFYGTPQGVMPTQEQAPVYSNHVIGLSYMYNF